jgi:radical SAM protein with 4Fe4S-binding SPASM domain
MPCESTLESSYINVKGEFFPCSFIEGTPGWEEGVLITKSTNFIEDVWNHLRVEDFRKKLLETENCNPFHCRSCVYYQI